MVSGNYEPTIIGFLCNWCAYQGADLAGTARMEYPPNVRPVRVMCSGRIDPTFILKAFAEGADGVLIGGCHPGDCHYLEGNYKCIRRMTMMHRVLERFGIEPERFRVEWVSASEGAKWAKICKEMTEQVKALGPLRWWENVRTA